MLLSSRLSLVDIGIPFILFFGLPDLSRLLAVYVCFRGKGGTQERPGVVTSRVQEPGGGNLDSSRTVRREGTEVRARKGRREEERGVSREKRTGTQKRPPKRGA